MYSVYVQPICFSEYICSYTNILRYVRVSESRSVKRIINNNNDDDNISFAVVDLGPPKRWLL